MVRIIPSIATIALLSTLTLYASAAPIREAGGQLVTTSTGPRRPRIQSISHDKQDRDELIEDKTKQLNNLNYEISDLFQRISRLDPSDATHLLTQLQQKQDEKEDLTKELAKLAPNSECGRYEKMKQVQNDMAKYNHQPPAPSRSLLSRIGHGHRGV